VLIATSMFCLTPPGVRQVRLGIHLEMREDLK
jgi:hypothetical protein